MGKKSEDKKIVKDKQENKTSENKALKNKTSENRTLENKASDKVSAVLNLLISVFLLTAIHTFVKPCQGVMDMPCNYSVRAAERILIIVIILSLGKWFVQDTKGTLFLNIATVTAGIELALIQNIGRCQVNSMTCNTKTFPVLRVGALLLVVLTVIFQMTHLVGRNRK